MNRIKTFLKLLLKEFVTPLNYILAFIVGILINFLTTGMPFSHLSTFLVPVFVQAISKSILLYKNRKKDMLLLLPQEREDPAFLLNDNGYIVAALGRTEKLFKDNNIANIDDFVNLEYDFKTSNIEGSFSKITGKWYSLEVKRELEFWLVWLTDITERVYLDLRLSFQSQFSDEIINSIDDLLYRKDVYDGLAKLILSDGYGCVFITRMETRNEDSLSGKAYKMVDGKSIHSHKIRINTCSTAPIFLSSKSNDIVFDSIYNYKDQSEFERARPFNSEIKEFISSDILNFVNYQKGDVAIIAFNKDKEISHYDLRAMISAVDTTRVVSSLLDLAKHNDLMFREAMDGLCAASEFSDDITGKHIYRVNKYSELIARELGLDERTCIWIGQVAAIHDIGKVAMPEIIKMETIYTKEERAKMQVHTIYGAEIIDKMLANSSKQDQRLLLARKIALNHHQEWLGTGYPGLVTDSGDIVTPKSTDPMFYANLRALKGDEIPIEALIVSLADRYDALRSPRHYKDGFSHEKTMEILSLDDRSGRTAEEYFGPRVSGVMIKIHLEMDKIYNSMAS